MNPHIEWIETTDGWRLQLMAFLPEVVRHPQPWLCIHGFSQSHLTWTAGGFAQHLAALGCPVYVLDLRGHGGSTIDQQADSWPRELGRGWDIDAYFFRDIPAAIDSIVQKHPGQSLFLCGHSMGGLMAAGTTAMRREEGIAGLVAIAAPFDPGRMATRIKVASQALLRLFPAVETARLPWHRLPMAQFFSWMDLFYFAYPPWIGKVLPHVAKVDVMQLIPRVWQPAHMEESTLRNILQQSYPEPMGVVLEFSRWIKEGVVRFGHPAAFDLTKAFHRISVPVVGAWGKEDFLAPPPTGAAFRKQIRSHIQYHLHLPRAHHIDITAGSPALEILDVIAQMLQETNKSIKST